MQRRDDALERVVEEHGLTPMRTSNSKRCVSVKNGSYWRTGLPLLLKTVQPLPTQRGADGRRVICGRPSAVHDDLAQRVACRDRTRARPGSSSGSPDRNRRSTTGWLDPRAACRHGRLTGMCLAGERCGDGRWLLLRIGLTPVARHVIDDPRARVAEQRRLPLVPSDLRGTDRSPPE